jgi:hypothetical protein
MQHIKDCSDVISDIKLIIERELSEKKKSKLNNFSDLLIKCMISGQKITLNSWKNVRIVHIKEGKLSYIPGETPELVRIVMYGYYTRKEE